MKILFLSDPNSEHTIKWANGLYSKGIEVKIFGLPKIKNNNNLNKNIKVISANLNMNDDEKINTKFSKLRYLKIIPHVKKILKDFKPNILHSHYASSYGLIGALLNYHPFILSVWGSDVFDFPKISYLNKIIFKFVLNSADRILSTSNIMTKEINNYTNKEIRCTPFGIDTDLFKSFYTDSLFAKKDFIIGTVKNLEKIYGIDTLIQSFKYLKEKHSQLNVKLLIIGDGSERKNLIELAKKLDIDKDILFTGKVYHSELPKYYNMMNVAVFLSRKESFGVSVLESSSCELPVIVSNIGGLPEVVENGITGLIVNKDDPESTANAISEMIFKESLKNSLGKNGRARVLRDYNFKDNLEQMINIYKEVIS